MPFIYAIVNKLNNKIYIGQTIDIKRRWNSHLYDLRNNSYINTYLQRAWNNDSENNFEFKILEETSDEFLNQKEEYWINFYKSFNRKYGYNLTTGGDNLKLSEEVKEQISKSMTGKPKSDSHKENIRKSRIGKSPSNKGKAMSEEQKDKIRKTFKEKQINKGIKKTEEHKNKISESMKKIYLNK